MGGAPSRTEEGIAAYAEEHDAMLCFDPDGNSGLPGLGLILRAQRAGDLALTRPVFLPEPDPSAWEYLPAREKARF
ncbi:hypothetical protein [Actinoplanes sp. L3-i22]|uniref:hypothetical protein n=1 Tax=Actinoplanes sp. L3-i22 TaxID=2836373 RepID=UPI001C78A229|nr:hypothetical protein [Actinoplanes sp. L3-i22]BCY10617.1 hypothetical protein L3i22_057050 [Actinoplanes sp. L3-i22]